MKKQLFKLSAIPLLLYGLQAQADIQILSATIKDQKIEGASAILQKNGEQSIAGVSDANGKIVFNSEIDNDTSSLLIVKKEGFSDLVVKCPCGGLTYAISPIMKNLDGLRIVLNWGANPSDLDSHLVYPQNHVFFTQMNGTDAKLDVDDTNSWGPETITIEKKHDGERYVYAVHNYSEAISPNSTGLSSSKAKVFVYVGQTLIKTYYVPENQVGNLWTVFAVTESGEFQEFNTIKGVAGSYRLQTSEFQGIVDSSTVAVIDYSEANQNSAKEINKKGEQAYHAKKYDEAIRLYKEAIELDGNYGQAYSNLGLVFQKSGNVSEALWANRKSIALAHGSTAATVRASSHFNNGKIYEGASQWNDALREYEAAKSEKNNPVYDKAIQKMKSH